MEKGMGKVERLCVWFTHHRVGVLLFIVISAIVVGAGAYRVKSEVILSEMFAYSHPYVQLSARFSKIFGGGGTTAAIVINKKKGDIFDYKTLQKVKDMTDEVVLWEEVYRMLTSSMGAFSSKVVKNKAGGEIAVESLMFPTVPKTPEEINELKKNVYSNKVYDGSLVSHDGTAALILTEFKENVSYGATYALLRGLEKKYADDETSIHITGFPMLMGWIYSFQYHLYAVFAVTVVLMLIILFAIFRNFIGLIVPASVGIITTLYGLGFIGWSGINFSPLMYVLVFLVGARMVSHAVQITHRYFEEMYVNNYNKEKACYETILAMLMPNIAGVITDAGGFTVLYLAKIVLMQNIAIIMTCWMMGLVTLSVIVPVVCTFLPLKDLSKSYSKKEENVDWVGKGIRGLTLASIGPRGRYVLFFIIVTSTMFFMWEGSGVKVGDPSPGSPLLWPYHKYNQDQDLINKKFKASSETFVLYFDGKQEESVYASVVSNTFEKFDRYMADTLPDIYKSSSSILSTAKMLNTLYHDGDEVWNELPREAGALIEIMGQVKVKLTSPGVRRFWDETLSKANLTLFFVDHTSDNVKRITDASRQFFKDNPMKVPEGEFRLAGGGIGQEIGLNEEMVASHVKIDLLVYITIFLMCVICFRSWVAGLMLTAPLFIANSASFAYMSAMGIGLSVNTLPVAAVCVGVGVDFAIYLYSRAMEEYPVHKDWTKTIMASVSTCGEAILYTGLVIILAVIPWYFISPLKFQAQMGFFLAMMMGINLILALTLHPLMLLVIKPRFVQRGVIANSNELETAP
jgi:predicted RND superfamily exporter protein